MNTLTQFIHEQIQPKAPTAQRTTLTDIAHKCQAFLHCTYNDPADYITAEWLMDKTNIQTIITLIQFSLADDLRGLAQGTFTKADVVGIESNVEFDFELMQQLKTLV